MAAKAGSSEGAKRRSVRSLWRATDLEAEASGGDVVGRERRLTREGAGRPKKRRAKRGKKQLVADRNQSSSKT